MAEREIFTIDVGGTAIKYGTASPCDGEPRLAAEGAVPMNCTSRDAFFRLLKELYEKYGNGASGIGLSMPGIVDTDRELNITCGAMEDFLEAGCPTAAVLSGLCGVTVHLINDAKAAALAEARFGALKGCKYGAVLIIGNGVGGAFVMDGKVLTGAHFAAGEFSRVFSEIRRPGEEGLWYQYGSCHRLCRDAGSERSGNGKGTDGEQEELSGEEVFRLVRKGDRKAVESLDSYARDMAAMLQSVQMFYDPELIAIGGGLSRDELLIEKLREQTDIVYREASGSGFPKPRVEACRYHGSANLIGAYINYTDRENRR